MSLESTEDLYVMRMKNDAKFEGELTCYFKIDMRNLMNYIYIVYILHIYLMNYIYCKVYILFELKKYRGIIVHETEGGYKICRGIKLSFQNWHKEFDKI